MRGVLDRQAPQRLQPELKARGNPACRALTALEAYTPERDDFETLLAPLLRAHGLTAQLLNERAEQAGMRLFLDTPSGPEPSPDVIPTSAALQPPGESPPTSADPRLDLRPRC